MCICIALRCNNDNIEGLTDTLYASSYIRLITNLCSLLVFSSGSLQIYTLIYLNTDLTEAEFFTRMGIKQ